MLIDRPNMASNDDDTKTEIISDQDEIEEDEKKFEFQAKSVCLTYSQADNLTKGLILEAAKKWGIVKYVIGQEEHQDGHPHFHCYFTFPVRLHTRNKRYFDINGYHPKIKKEIKGKGNGWIEYCMKDGNYEMSGIELFPSSLNFRKRKSDFDSWLIYCQLKRRKSVEWPIKLPSGELLERPTGKRRHYWIKGMSSAGKSSWIQNQFANQRVFIRTKSNYPYDDYSGEEVIIFDDHYPKFSEIAAVSERYFTMCRVYGDTRYTTKYWPMAQERVMFVLSNNDPDYGNIQEAFDTRFNVIDVSNQ